MASFSVLYLYLHASTILIVLSSLASGLASSASLSPAYYDRVCPQALPTIRRIVEDAVRQERRMGASLLRLHFHDCFVNGCDASILLDATPTIDSEKNALPNANSARGFEVIDGIKAQVDKVCGRPVVSCADILAVAARDSVVAEDHLGWSGWAGETPRRPAGVLQTMTYLRHLWIYRHSLAASRSKVSTLKTLWRGHTLGFAQCRLFRNRIYNETNNIDPSFATQMRAACPSTGGDSNLGRLDASPAVFDTAYFSNLVSKRGLLHSDQALHGTGGPTQDLVKSYATNFLAFSNDFGNSMIKMGNIKPLTGKRGQIRFSCRKVN